MKNMIRSARILHLLVDAKIFCNRTFHDIIKTDTINTRESQENHKTKFIDERLKTEAKKKDKTNVTTKCWEIHLYTLYRKKAAPQEVQIISPNAKKKELIAVKG
jgi:hypothetical protein